MSEEEHRWRKDGRNAALPKGEFDLRGGLNVLLKVFYWGHRPLRQLGCYEIGRRSAGDWSATLPSLALVLAWGAWTGSVALLYAGTGLAVLLEGWHRLRPGTGHSRYFGTSRFAGLLNGNLRGHLLTSALAVLTGLAVVQFSDKGLGSYLVFAGAGYATWAVFLDARERHLRQDQADAEHLSCALHEGRG